MLPRPQEENTNQIKSATFLLTRLGLELRWWMVKRQLVVVRKAESEKRKKWFNLGLQVLQLDREKTLFSISLSALIKLAFWVGWCGALRDDRSLGDKWYPRSGEATCTDVAELTSPPASRNWKGRCFSLSSRPCCIQCQHRPKCAAPDALLIDCRCLDIFTVCVCLCVCIEKERSACILWPNWPKQIKIGFQFGKNTSGKQFTPPITHKRKENSVFDGNCNYKNRKHFLMYWNQTVQTPPDLEDIAFNFLPWTK